jgi:transposase-like protein
MTDEDRVRWTKLVADYESSDLTQREFAVERGVSFSNLRNWIYKLRKETRPLDQEPPKVSGQVSEREAVAGGSRLVPVRVVASAAKPRRAVSVRIGDDTLLELALPSGARLRFPVGTDPRYLQALAAAL